MTQRTMYHKELEQLERATVQLGGLVAERVGESVALLTRDDRAASGRLIELDTGINKRRYELEADALTLIATQQPVAGEMRLVAAVLDIVSELERIGDYAKGTAKIHLLSDQPFDDEALALLEQMAERSKAMLVASLRAFETRDVTLAEETIDDDDAVDALFNQVFRYVLHADPDDSDGLRHANYLLWIAHNLERTADRATNICERVRFTVTGELSPLVDSG